ncbi:MAG: hypothetical protein ACPGSD_08635 [Flavobacteriales bacterium]
MKNLKWIYLFYLVIACSKSKTTNELPKESIESIFPVNRTCKDSSLLVTKQELIYLIKKANSIVKNKEIEDFSDDEHILMMMLLNTKGVFIPKENNINVSFWGEIPRL